MEKKLCPTHLLEMTQMYSGKLDDSQNWEQKWYCPREVESCVNLQGTFAGHAERYLGSTGGFFSRNYSKYECQRCGKQREEEVSGGY